MHMVDTHDLGVTRAKLHQLTLACQLQTTDYKSFGFDFTVFDSLK